VSIEPMLGPIYLGQAGAIELYRPGYDNLSDPVNLNSDFPQIEAKGLIDWVIAGCESGPKRRPAKIQWFRDLKNQCVDAGVPFFLKQTNGYINGKSQVVHSPILDGQKWEQRP